MATNYYDVLGISRSATEKDVRQAFRRLARQHHPDVNPGDKAAEQKFKEINEAYEALSDPEKRKKYDRFGENWKYADRMPQDDGRPGAGQFRWDFRGAPHAGVGGDVLRQCDVVLGVEVGCIVDNLGHGVPRERPAL